MRDEDTIKDIAELVKMALQGKNVDKTIIQNKVKDFCEWNNNIKFYEFALNLTSDEQEAVVNQVCVWCGL